MSQRHQRPGKPLAEKSSIASMLADAFVTSRLTVAFILACILIGSWALLITPRQDNPRIVVPAASITVDLPGATPAEVEALVIRPLEAAIKQVPGVDDVFSSDASSGEPSVWRFSTAVASLRERGRRSGHRGTGLNDR